MQRAEGIIIGEKVKGRTLYFSSTALLSIPPYSWHYSCSGVSSPCQSYIFCWYHFTVFPCYNTVSTAAPVMSKPSSTVYTSTTCTFYAFYRICSISHRTTVLKKKKNVKKASPVSPVSTIFTRHQHFHNTVVPYPFFYRPFLQGTGNCFRAHIGASMTPSVRLPKCLRFFLLRGNSCDPRGCIAGLIQAATNKRVKIQGNHSTIDNRSISQRINQPDKQITQATSQSTYLTNQPISSPKTTSQSTYLTN